MGSWREKLRTRVRGSILLRPAAFVLGGAVIATLVLQFDATIDNAHLPGWMLWTPGSARFLYATLAGAMLTFAGLTFLVRSTIVSLAASQYSARVVVGFLEDRFQQSMMSLMLGLFAYTLIVLRALPDPDPGVTALAVPQFSVLVGILSTIGAVTVVMAAIRNAVRSMYAGALARTTTEAGVDRLRAAYPPLRGPIPAPAERARPAPDASLTAGRGEGPQPPARPGTHVRATGRGWVQEIDEDALLQAMPPGALLQLEVRVGLYVIDGRPLATVWPADRSEFDIDLLTAAITLGRTRIYAADVENALQTLVDIAVGSLESGAADVAATYEVVQHVEMLLRELAHRRLPTRVRTGPEGRILIRDRVWSFEDYVRTAFDRLRRAGASYPSVVNALLNAAGELALELHDEGLHERAVLLEVQLDRILASASAADLVEEDLDELRATAERYRVRAADAADTSG